LRKVQFTSHSETKNYSVFFIEQTDQARPVRLSLDLGVTQVWYCAKKWRTKRPLFNR